MKPIRLGWTTGQKTVKGFMWSRKSRTTTASLQELTSFKIIYYKSCNEFSLYIHRLERLLLQLCPSTVCIHDHWWMLNERVPAVEGDGWEEHICNTLCTYNMLQNALSFIIHFLATTFFSVNLEYKVLIIENESHFNHYLNKSFHCCDKNWRLKR